MKALKGLLIYIGIVLAIILGIGLILLCIMYFAPSVRIFGVGVVHYNKQVSADPIVLTDYSDYSDIELNVNSKKIGISIVPAETDNIKYSLNLSIFGISTEIVEYQVIKTIEVKDNKLHIYLNVSEPNGWISSSDSILEVEVPASGEFNILTNSKSGNISIGSDDYSANINNLSVSTDSGNLSLINLGSGEETKTLDLNTLNLTTGNGYFDLSNIDTINVNNEVKLVASDGKFKFNNLNASVDITGNGVTLEASNVTCGSDGFTVIAKNGFFDIDKLTTPVGAENTFMTDDTMLEIDEIYGKTGIVTVYGDIDIGVLNDYAMIENTNGVVSVTTANDNIIVNTTYGNINVEKYYKTGKFTSNRGNITVNSYSDYVKGYYTEIKNVDGNVTVFNKINLLLVTTTGRSIVEVTFGQIKEGFETSEDIFQHTIKASTHDSASCNVYIPTLNIVPFRFIAKGDGISGDIQGFVNNNNYYEVEASDQEQYYPNSDTKDDSLMNARFWFEGKVTLKGHSKDYA